MSITQRDALLGHIAGKQLVTAPVTVVIRKDTLLIRSAPHTIVKSVITWADEEMKQGKTPLVTVTVTPEGLLIS